jgi:hypothetical protein
MRMRDRARWRIQAKEAANCSGLSRVTVAHFFIVPPGVVALPLFSADPATGAPWVLASFADGMELPVVAPVAPFCMPVPPPPVVLPFMEPPVVVLLAAGPPALESPPAVLLVCANASVVESASAVASAIVLIVMGVSSGSFPLGVAPWESNLLEAVSFLAWRTTKVAEVTLVG